MKFEVFVSSPNYQSYFNPCFYKKFKTTETVKTDYGIVKIYELGSVYLAILFTDEVIYDGLTVVKRRDRDGYYGIGYIDEVGNFEFVETSKEKLLRKLAYLKRYKNKIVKEIKYPTIKKDNIDPLEPEDYWNIRELYYNKLYYNKTGTEPKRLLSIRLEDGRYWKNGIINVFMLQREGRDNKDFIVAYDTTEPKGEDKVLEIYGKAGETYILKPYAIRHLCDEQEAIRFMKVIKQDYEKVENLEVLDKEAYELLDKINEVCYNTT